MGRSGARSRVVGEAILCSGKAFGNQTNNSTRSSERDYVCQGEVEVQTAYMVFSSEPSTWTVLQVYPPAPRNVLTVLAPRSLMFSMAKRYKRPLHVTNSVALE